VNPVVVKQHEKPKDHKSPLFAYLVRKRGLT